MLSVSGEKVSSVPENTAEKVRLRPYILGLALLWTLLLGVILTSDIIEIRQGVLDYARAEARGSFNKDLVYRRWAASHGGVYVPITEATPPSPYLSHVEERDIETPSGRRLTLMNPAYMTRQVYELGEEQYGARGHITSLNPIRPENAPDPWERSALEAFEQGESEISSIEMIGEVPHLRLMRPMITEEPCMKCHAQQGYQVGDVRGGISVSIPLAPYSTWAWAHEISSLSGFGLLWVIGLCGIGFGARHLRQRIIERQRAEMDQVQLMSAIEHVAETIVITDAEGSIQYVNPAFERITGYSREEALGQNPRILSGGKHDEAFYRRMWETLEGGEVWCGRLTNKRKDGTPFEADASISPVRDTGGSITHYVAVERDVTHETELEKQLRHAQKMQAMGTLAGGIAHDFNNVLTAILGQCQLALSCQGDDSLVHDSLNEIIRAGTRATDLVKQIMTFSRQTEQEEKPVQLAAIAKEVLALLRGSLPSTIEIRCQIDGACPPVMADATQLHQVVMNICTNAYHAMEERGGVLKVALAQDEITAEHAEGYLDLKAGRYNVLRISDTGHGMDEETRQRVFEPYFTTKPEGKGTGMGMATVHGIVKNIGGTVHVYSEPGKGTEFKIYLPICDVPERSAPEPAKTMKYGKGEHVLLVDDERAVLEFGADALKAMGYRITTFSCPTEALESFRANPRLFDLVITDRTMPEMTGNALAVELLSIREDLPVILTTGLSNAEISEEASRAGIVETVPKPFCLAKLSDAVHNALSHGGANKS